MLSGTFDIRIDTPKTFKRGTVALAGEGGKITATLNAGPLENASFEGSYEGKDFAFDVDTQVEGLGALSGKFTGNVWGNSLSAVGDTNMGKVEIMGTSISTATGDSNGRPGSMYAGRWSDGY